MGIGVGVLVGLGVGVLEGLGVGVSVGLGVGGLVGGGGGVLVAVGSGVLVGDRVGEGVAVDTGVPVGVAVGDVTFSTIRVATGGGEVGIGVLLGADIAIVVGSGVGRAIMPAASRPTSANPNPMKAHRHMNRALANAQPPMPAFPR